MGTGESAFSAVFESIEFLIKPVGFSILVILLILLMIPLGKKLIIKLRIRKFTGKGMYGEALLVKYRAYTGRLRKKKIIISSNADTYEIAEEVMEKAFSEEKEDSIIRNLVFTVAEIARKAAFSGRDISEEEYKTALAHMKRVLKAAEN